MEERRIKSKKLLSCAAAIILALAMIATTFIVAPQQAYAATDGQQAVKIVHLKKTPKKIGRFYFRTRYTNCVGTLEYSHKKRSGFRYLTKESSLYDFTASGKPVMLYGKKLYWVNDTSHGFYLCTFNISTGKKRTVRKISNKTEYLVCKENISGKYVYFSGFDTYTPRTYILNAASGKVKGYKFYASYKHKQGQALLCSNSKHHIFLYSWDGAMSMKKIRRLISSYTSLDYDNPRAGFAGDNVYFWNEKKSGKKYIYTLSTCDLNGENERKITTLKDIDFEVLSYENDYCKVQAEKSDDDDEYVYYNIYYSDGHMEETTEE